MISSVDFGIRVLADKNIQNIGDLIKRKKFPVVVIYARSIHTYGWGSYDGRWIKSYDLGSLAQIYLWVQ